ncbi:MAG: hypothetical protein AAFR93_17835, partial [Pseudomonadota bacterium]
QAACGLWQMVENRPPGGGRAMPGLGRAVAYAADVVRPLEAAPPKGETCPARPRDGDQASFQDTLCQPRSKEDGAEPETSQSPARWGGLAFSVILQITCQQWLARRPAALFRAGGGDECRLC